MENSYMRNCIASDIIFAKCNCELVTPKQIYVETSSGWSFGECEKLPLFSFNTSRSVVMGMSGSVHFTIWQCVNFRKVILDYVYEGGLDSMRFSIYECVCAVQIIEGDIRQ